MPELPEVETTCQEVRPYIVGQTVKRLIVRQKRLRWLIPSALAQIKGARIKAVKRRAKYILLMTTKGTVIIHLGMSGRLRILKEGVLNQKHDHVDLIFTNGLLLRYTDPRRFGAFLFTTQDPLQYPLLAKLGPEPFSKVLNAKYLFQSAQRKSITVKQFIMDQQIIVGVGNIYANEALFLAKVSPLRLANLLTVKEWQLLIKAIQKILKKAITKGGTTFQSFLSPKGKIGYFIQQLAVYGREKENCYQCATPLSAIRIAQRATVFCAFCQK